MARTISQIESHIRKAQHSLLDILDTKASNVEVRYYVNLIEHLRDELAMVSPECECTCGECDACGQELDFAERRMRIENEIESDLRWRLDKRYGM